MRSPLSARNPTLSEFHTSTRGVSPQTPAHPQLQSPPVTLNLGGRRERATPGTVRRQKAQRGADRRERGVDGVLPVDRQRRRRSPS